MRADRAQVVTVPGGPLLNGIRLAMGQTQAQIAEAVSTQDDPVSEWVIKAYCQGHRRSMRVDRARRIAEVLGVPLRCIVTPVGHRAVQGSRARRAGGGRRA